MQVPTLPYDDGFAYSGYLGVGLMVDVTPPRQGARFETGPWCFRFQQLVPFLEHVPGRGFQGLYPINGSRRDELRDAYRAALKARKP
jgi:hypothetical protein